MTLCAPVFWLKRFQIFGFRRNIYLPAPPPYQSHISPVSAFLSKFKPSLLACRAAAFSPATLLHAPRPRLSRQVIHTRPHPPPPSTSHMPRPPAGARHLPAQSLTPPPNKRQPKPWCTQYSQDLKEHLAAEKQIAAARVDEVAMAAIRVDPRSWRSTSPSRPSLTPHAPTPRRGWLL